VAGTTQSTANTRSAVFVEGERPLQTVSFRLLWVLGDRAPRRSIRKFEGQNDHEIQQYARASASGQHQRRLSVRGADHRYRRHAYGGRSANQVVTAAYGQPRPQAAASLRSYFTAHSQEYYDLRGILAPIGDTERQCNVTALSPDLQSAYQEFMAG
jgi:hypothetical protein